MSKLMTLRARWEGRYPEVGHFLRTAKGRNAYEISRVREIQPGRLRLRVLRWPAKEVPEHAVVHHFKWDGRKKRNPPR